MNSLDKMEALYEAEMMVLDACFAKKFTNLLIGGLK